MEEAAAVLLEEEAEEEGSQEVSAAPTPTLHLPSLRPAGAVVKAKVRTVTRTRCSRSPIPNNLYTTSTLSPEGKQC